MNLIKRERRRPSGTVSMCDLGQSVPSPRPRPRHNNGEEHSQSHSTQPGTSDGSSETETKGEGGKVSSLSSKVRGRASSRPSERDQRFGHSQERRGPLLAVAPVHRVLRVVLSRHDRRDEEKCATGGARCERGKKPDPSALHCRSNLEIQPGRRGMNGLTSSQSTTMILPSLLRASILCSSACSPPPGCRAAFSFRGMPEPVGPSEGRRSTCLMGFSLPNKSTFRLVCFIAGRSKGVEGG